MAESASLRAQKRWDTSRRITVHAQRLTEAHGLDGFTMEELAAAAGVSRRTLFNYFPSKVDAVLGEVPEIPDEAVDVFRSGGPHADLVDDLAVLARLALEVEPEREALELGRRVLTRDPRVLAAVHQRFAAITEEFAALVREREGPDYPASQARLVLRLVLTLLDSALEAFLEEDDGRLLVEVFDEHVRAARSLLS